MVTYKFLEKADFSLNSLNSSIGVILLFLLILAAYEIDKRHIKKIAMVVLFILILINSKLLKSII